MPTLIEEWDEDGAHFQKFNHGPCECCGATCEQLALMSKPQLFIELSGFCGDPTVELYNDTTYWDWIATNVCGLSQVNLYVFCEDGALIVSASFPGYGSNFHYSDLFGGSIPLSDVASLDPLYAEVTISNLDGDTITVIVYE